LGRTLTCAPTRDGPSQHHNALLKILARVTEHVLTMRYALPAMEGKLVLANLVIQDMPTIDMAVKELARHPTVTPTSAGTQERTRTTSTIE